MSSITQPKIQLDPNQLLGFKNRSNHKSETGINAAIGNKIGAVKDNKLEIKVGNKIGSPKP